MSLWRDRGLYTSASFSGQSDFVSQKSCICVNAFVTKSACPTAAEKRLSASICLCLRCRSQPLSSVSRKQRYNTLDFAKQNRVPTGMLRAPIGNPAAKRCSLCNPSFSSQVHIQTAKTQLATTAQKMQKEACAGTWHRLPFGRKCRRRRGVFFCIPAIRCGGDGGGRIETGVLAIKKSWIVYRLQHYENRRLFDFLLRTEPTVDAT